MGELQEVARTTTFLASQSAGFINGQALAVNGGLDWAP
jgi:NAD(P)-dependent dehydrogenase (short-subunit alcohol dehydrogenase family)